MDITAIIASYKRPNLSIILEALKGADIKEIWVINDDPDKHLELDGVAVFNNGKNLGAMARGALAVMASTSHVLCHDDDLMIEGPGTIANLMRWQLTYPEAIVGYYGRQCKWDSDKPYTDGLYMAGASYADSQPINIIFAKMMLAKVSKYAQAWGLFAELKNYTMEEDTLISMANLVAGYQNYLVPAKKGQRCLPLSEHGHSLSERQGFWESRDAAIKCIVEGRWGEARAALVAE
uniref:Putative glycosyltransferase n=1 Tax=viral metagenome TaxID=1070528 RepID=A0A6M3LZD2_9ZZZZ